MRIGIGYDVHPSDATRALYLGGVRIDGSPGLRGHSDADALLHAVIDALLGAAGLGDIGQHFPPDDPAYKDIDSRELLRKARDLLEEKGYHVGNVDATIVAEKPRLSPCLPAMRWPSVGMPSAGQSLKPSQPTLTSRCAARKSAPSQPGCPLSWHPAR